MLEPALVRRLLVSGALRCSEGTAVDQREQAPFRSLLGAQHRRSAFAEDALAQGDDQYGWPAAAADTQKPLRAPKASITPPATKAPKAMPMPIPVVIALGFSN